MTLGIDVGGTNLVLGLVRDGKIVKRVSGPWSPREATLQETIDTLSERIAGIITPDTEKIGIGVPSVVDVTRGIVYDTVNIPSWTEVPLKELLEQRFRLPVAVNNDANCGAGELGSLPYRSATLEAFCSKQFFAGSGWDSMTASRAARDGDPRAKALFTELGGCLGDLLCTVMFAYDPSHIALGGGIANNYPLFRQAMEARLKRDFPYRKSLERLTVGVCTGDDIPVIGASLI